MDPIDRIEKLSFSSLYIGILAATARCYQEVMRVRRFSSLYIGILAATNRPGMPGVIQVTFQFPLHRDPRCNSK